MTWRIIIRFAVFVCGSFPRFDAIILTLSHLIQKFIARGIS